MINEFYKVDTNYKYLTYPGVNFRLIEFTDTHAVFLRSDGIKHFIPHSKQNVWMFKKVNIGRVA